MRRRIIFLVVISLVLISLIAMAQQKLDRVTKVDGSSVTGHLDSVDETSVRVNGTAVPRSDVKAILFAGARPTTDVTQSSSNTQPQETELTDLVVKSVGGSSYGHVSGVSENEVIQNGNHLSRTAVATIQFNVRRPGQVVTTPTPSPSASPSPSPSPSASTGAGEGGSGDQGSSGKGNEPTSGGGATGSGSRPEPEKTLPPWFGNPSKDWCPDRDWESVMISQSGNLTGETKNGVSQAKCFVDIYVCGHTIHKEFGPVDNAPHACEQFGTPSSAVGLDGKQFVCCSRLKESKSKPGKHCDGTKDLDCDGVPDDQDDYPLDPNCSDRTRGCHVKKSN